MEFKLIDSVVLNTIQASAADLTLSGDKLTVNGMTTTIPFRNVFKLNPYTLTAYSAGVAQVVAVTFDNALVADTKVYHLEVTMTPAVDPGLINANVLYDGVMQFQIITTTGTTGTTVAAAFHTAIDAILAQGGTAIDASHAANVLTLTCTNALFSISVRALETITSSIADTTAYVRPSGSYAQVVLINGSATSGSTYDTHTYRFTQPIDTAYPFTDGVQLEPCMVKVFVKVGAANKAAFDTAIAGYNDGTSLDVTSLATLRATTLKYLGIV